MWYFKLPWSWKTHQRDEEVESVLLGFCENPEWVTFTTIGQNCKLANVSILIPARSLNESLKINV